MVMFRNGDARNALFTLALAANAAPSTNSLVRPRRRCEPAFRESTNVRYFIERVSGRRSGR